jgi:hypothetical protein
MRGAKSCFFATWDARETDELVRLVRKFANALQGEQSERSPS